MDFEVTFEELVQKPFSVPQNEENRFVLKGDRIESTVALDQLVGMVEARGKSFFVPWMMMCFGADIPIEKYEGLFDELKSGSFVHPPIKVVLRPTLGRHWAAYNRRKKQIEVDRPMALAASEGDNEAAWILLTALIEEFGHHIDHTLREGRGDARRDEGARFGYSLLNLGWKEQSSFAFGTYEHRHSGETRELRVDWSEVEQMAEELLGEQAQASDERDESREYFGAGRMNHGVEHPHSWGHQSIEEAALAHRPTPPADDVVARIYFGNWLRDYSQVVTDQTKKLASAETWARVVNLLSHGEFGVHSDFDVSREILGEYRWEEHIDNPTGCRGVSSDMLSFDSNLMLPRYIRWDQSPTTTALGYMVGELSAAVSIGDNVNGWRHLGQALHTLEDFYAHSNYAELALIQSGQTGIHPCTSVEFPNGKYALVTGRFGDADTAASLLLSLAEKLYATAECEFSVDEPPATWRMIAVLLEELLMRGLGTSAQVSVRREWDAHGDELLMLLHRVYQLGIRGDHPFAEMGAQAVVRTAVYGMCSVASLAAKFGATVLAAAADWLAERVLGRQALYDGTAAGVLRSAGNAIGVGQTMLAGIGPYPTHTQLAKDHDDHPLHDLAANMAKDAVADVFNQVKRSWRGQCSSSDVSRRASEYFVHPATVRPGSAAMASLVRAQGFELSRLERRRLGNPRWAVGRHWPQIQRRAGRLIERSMPEGREHLMRMLTEQWDQEP